MSNLHRVRGLWRASEGQLLSPDPIVEAHDAHRRVSGIARLVRFIVATLTLLSAIAALVLIAPAEADGTTLYVSGNGADSGDCSSSASPCATITYALTQANSGDTIEVSGTIDDNPTVTMAVAIAQMPGGSPAVVSGDTDGSVFTINSKADAEVTLDGITVENGESNYGGGIAINGNSIVTVTNSTISGNTASDGGQGGGIYNNASVTVTNSTISGNTASNGGQGGGIYADGTATVTDSTISLNAAEDGGQGGGIYNDGTATVTDSTISGNTAADGGQGAGLDNQGLVTVTDSTIAGNTLPGAGGGQGGGIYNDSTAVVTDSTISGNTASDGGQGGAIYSGAAAQTVLQQANLQAARSLSTSQCLKCTATGDSLTLAGDIVATAGGAPAGSECAGGWITDAGYNVDDDGTCSLSGTSISDSSTIDGYLGSLADNGGPTDTIVLLPGTMAVPNPAQAAIPADFTASGQTTFSCSQPDQRGLGRGVPCDMGAYALTAPAVTSADSATFTVGNVGSFQVVANSAPAMKFSVTGTLPAGVSLSSSGLLSGSPGPATGGTYPITVTASNGMPPDATQNFTLTVDEAPTITSAESTIFSIGHPGTFVVTSAGAPAAGLNEIGALPAGITFTDRKNGTGTLSGTPRPGADGVYPITVIATNGINPSAIKTLTLTVDQAPAITSGGRAGFTLGQPGSFTVTTTGLPSATLHVNGALPAGLTLSNHGDGTATISGTPRLLTRSPVTLSVHAANTEGSVTSPLVVTVSSGTAWLAGNNGAVYPAGTASSFGSMQAYRLNSPMVGIAATPDGRGYWLVSADGGVFSCGDAAFFGSAGNIHLNQPIVGMAATPDGGGYWLVASDGGIFAFGDAAFFGSTGNIHLNQPIVGMAATPDGGGYWLVASDGGIFAFGDARFFGSVAGGSGSLSAPVVGIASSTDGKGYSLATADGDVIPFGDGVAGGGLGGVPAPIVGISGP
jgi:hypothetical protein